MKRKLLSVLLTFCLAFSLLPTAALADAGKPVAEINGTGYSTLSAAIEEANDEDTIVMTRDCTVAGAITFPAGKRLTVDLNGKTITATGSNTGGWAIINGTVTFKGAGYLGDTTHESVGYLLNVNENAVLNIEGTATYESGLTVVQMQGANSKCSILGGTFVGDTYDGKYWTLNKIDAYRDTATIQVSGGTFKGFDPSNGHTENPEDNFLAPGYGVKQDGDNYIVTEPVAAIGNTKYPTLAAAVADAKDGDTITLTDNIEVENTLVVTKTLTLDLAGHTLSNEKDIWSDDNWSLISVRENGNLTITGNGMLKAKENDCYPVDVQDEGAQLTIENGTFIGNIHAVYVKTGAAYIKGGTYSVQQKYPDPSKTDEFVLNLYDANRRNGTAKLSVSGGIFVAFNPANCQAEAQGTNFCAAGYTTTENNSTYTVVEGENAAVANAGANYNTLANAISSAASGDTVTLLKDTKEDITIPAGKIITLDLNGNKLTNVSGHTITNNGTLFVTGNGTVDNIAHGKGALYNNTGATATLNGGTFTRSAEKGTASPDSANGNSWYTVKNYGTMTINSNVTITNTGSHSSAVANGWFDVSKAGSNGEPIYTTNAVLTINGGNISGGKITVKNDDYGTLTITGGSISQPLNGLYCIYNANVTAISGGNVNGPVGNYNGTSTEADQGKFSITGGYFTSKPAKEYIATGYYVVESDKDGYSCMISDTVPTKAQVIVSGTTAVTPPTNAHLTEADKTAIRTKTNVDGVAEAAAGSKNRIVKDAGVDASAVDASKLIEVEVAVDVAVSDVQKNAEGTAISTITFTAKPTATVKVDGNATGTPVPVENSMLNGQAITVKLPLPEGFTPEQIKHISSDRSVEYFLRTAKSGAKTFEIKDGCAVFTITKFSTFELSGTVTYVEPSYSSGGSSDPTYSVSTPSKTEHGTVTVSPKSASKGDRVTVTVKPDSGYVLETLTVTDKNGNELTLKDKGNGKYTFTMPAGKVEVKATFMEDNSMLNFFYDVPNNAYFYEAVKWAVKNGITDGVGNNLFAPEQPCTRAQIVTFLWRAAGSPEPKGAASGMTDVVSGSYYEKAVAWAIENGITTGTTTTTFSPDATCTRAQAVTFLARALKAKAASAAEFSDVPTDSYFADAVAWAAANGVTEGIGGGLFGSDNDCTRGQIVTFLYRAYNK